MRLERDREGRWRRLSVKLRGGAHLSPSAFFQHFHLVKPIMPCDFSWRAGGLLEGHSTPPKSLGCLIL